MAIRNINGKWYVDVRHRHRRYRKKCPINTKQAARAYEVDLLRDVLRDPRASQQQKHTFAQFSAQWFDIYVSANCKPSDQASKAGILRRNLLPRFGPFLLHEITTVEVEAYKQVLKARGLRPSSINNVLNVLGKCLRCATEWGALERLPIIKRLPVTQGPPRMLSAEERRRLQDAAQAEPWSTMVTVALGTGMRLSELCGLQWQDVDFDRGIVTVARSYVRGVISSPKNHRIRHIPMPRSVVEVLRARRRGRGPVFHLEDGELITQSRASHAIWRLSKLAGIRRVGWHTLRHTYASDLASRGVPMRAIQLLLGHASVTTTERYAHLTAGDLRSAVDALERPVWTTLGIRWASEGVRLSPRAADLTDASVPIS